MRIWAAMSIFLLFFSIFSYIAIDDGGGVGTRMLVLAFLSSLMFILRYRLNKQHRT
jgi:hypothetical protein